MPVRKSITCSKRKAPTSGRPNTRCVNWSTPLRTTLRQRVRAGPVVGGRAAAAAAAASSADQAQQAGNLPWKGQRQQRHEDQRDGQGVERHPTPHGRHACSVIDCLL